MNRAQSVGAAVALVVVVVATGLHSPFGGYRIDDGLYSRVEFLRLVREGFPEYADLRDGDLLERVFARYPAAKTWVREETTGADPLPLAIAGQETNARLRPPPAYFGAQSRRYSIHAVFAWIDEPVEYLGFVVPVILGAGLWVWLFRRRKA